MVIGIMAGIAALLVLGAVVLWSGCTSLTPFEEVRAAAGPGTYVPVNGARVYVEHTGQGKPPVVLLHGFAASSYTFRKLVPELARDREVIAIDWYGFGWTERPQDRSAYLPPGQVAMIAEVLQQRGIGRAHVLGHSFGAVLANAYARQHPERVASLVLLSPATRFDAVPWVLQTAAGRAVLYPFVRLMLSRPQRVKSLFARGYHEPETLTDADAEAYRQRLLVDGLWRALGGFFSGGDDADVPDRPGYGVAGIPMQVIAGRHDPIVPIGDLEALRDDLRREQPGLRWVVMEDSAHNAPEEQPEAMARALTTFFAEVESRD